MGNGVDGVLFWGTQTERGYGATSYIQTEANPVTRASDYAVIGGLDFSAFWRYGIFSVYVNCSANYQNGSASGSAPVGLGGLGNLYMNLMQVDNRQNIGLVFPALAYQFSDLYKSKSISALMCFDYLGASGGVYAVVVDGIKRSSDNWVHGDGALADWRDADQLGIGCSGRHPTSSGIFSGHIKTIVLSSRKYNLLEAEAIAAR